MKKPISFVCLYFFAVCRGESRRVGYGFVLLSFR